MGAVVDQPDAGEPQALDAVRSEVPVVDYCDQDAEDLIGLDVRSPSADTAVVEVTGEVDMYTAPLLEDCLREQLAGSAGVLVVDLRQVAFLDSSGLALLVQAHQQNQACGRSFRIVCVEGLVKRAIVSTGLDGTLALYDNISHAVDS